MLHLDIADSLVGYPLITLPQGVARIGFRETVFDDEPLAVGLKRTGQFALVVPTTVLEALSAAGGFQQWANRKNIRILRDGGRETLKFNYVQVTKGKNLDQNIYLQNGDMIIVP